MRDLADERLARLDAQLSDRLAALTLFAGAATQLLAAMFGYVAYWYGHPLYDPWQFLSWGLELVTARPWIAFFSILLLSAPLRKSTGRVATKMAMPGAGVSMCASVEAR